MIRMKAAITTTATMAIVAAGALAGPLVAHSEPPLGPDSASGEVAARIAAGNAMLVAMPDGRICGWGSNQYGHLGRKPVLDEDAWSTERDFGPEPHCFWLDATVSATAISSATWYAAALGSDGKVYTWGSDEWGIGYLGRDHAGTEKYLPHPQELPESVIPTAVSAGGEFVAVLTQDGRILTWGDNTYGQLGAGLPGGSDPWPNSVDYPVGVAAGDVRFTSVSAGGSHTLAVSTDGRVYAWGSDYSGQLGPGGTFDPEVYPPPLGFTEAPVEVTGLTDVVQVAAGSSHSVALTSDGHVYTWGSSTYGKLGYCGASQSSNVPTRIDIDQIAGISAGGDTTVAWTAEGQLYTWGVNDAGGLGLGTNFGAATPQEVHGFSVAAAATSGGTALAIGRDGQIYTWGANSYTQLGDRSQAVSAQPARVEGLPAIEYVAAGPHSTMAIAENGDLYTWGHNTYLTLGTDTVKQRSAPAKVEGLPPVAQGDMQLYHTAVVDTDGHVWTWGAIRNGELGYDPRDFGEQPSVGYDAVPTRRQVEGLSEAGPIASIGVGEDYTMLLTADGEIWGWGLNATRNLIPSGGANRFGLGEGVETAWSPRKANVEQPNGISALAVGKSSAAILAEGTVYGFGYNVSLQLGVREDPQQGVALPIASLPTDIVQVDTRGNVTVAVDAAGEVWTLGDDQYGQLGRPNLWGYLGTPMPAKVEGLPAIGIAEAGGRVTMALSEDRQHVYTWGAMGPFLYDAPGDAAATPVEALGIPGPIKQIAAGDAHAVALTEAGEVYTWGSNSSGQLGVSSSLWLPQVHVTSLRFWESSETPPTEPDERPIAELAELGLCEAAPGDEPSDPETTEPPASPTPSESETTDPPDSPTPTDTATTDPPSSPTPSESETTDPPDSPTPTDTGTTDPPSSPTPTDTGTTDPPSSPTPSESETTEPPDRPTPTDTTTDPTKAPSTEPSEDAGEDPGATPSGPPTTEGPRNTGGPNQPGANSDRKVDDTPDSPDSASGSLHASGAHESAATGLGAGTGNADLGAASIGETAPQATSPRLARFGTRFKTVVVPAGSNAKLRVTTYPAAGTPAGRVRVTWRTSTPSVASPIKGARTGTTTWQAGKDATVTLRTFRAGSTRIELTSPGARGATIQVTVLPQSVAKARRLRAVDLTGSSTLSAGRSTVLRPVLTPLGAVRTAGRWRSTNPAVATVDRVGRVTGHTKGRTVIVLTVGGKTTHKTITIT